MRWAKCSLFIARKFVRTVYLRGWLRCPINLPVNIWKVRWNVNTLLGSTVHNKNKTVMDAGSWGLVVSIRWFQPMRVRTRFLFLVASANQRRRHVTLFVQLPSDWASFRTIYCVDEKPKGTGGDRTTRGSWRDPLNQESRYKIAASPSGIPRWNYLRNQYFRPWERVASEADWTPKQVKREVLLRNTDNENVL